MEMLDIDADLVDECYYRSFGADDFEDIDLSSDGVAEGQDTTFEDWIACTHNSTDARECPDPGNRSYDCWE